MLKDIPKLVSELNENDLIYILTFNRDSDNNFISYTEGIEMIVKYTNVPIYGSWDFYLNKGIVGGKITAGFLQGATAAKQALQFLKGEPIDNIDIILDGASEYMFDYHFLTRNNVNINELPKDSIIINRPEKFLEKYQSVLLNIFVSLFILVLAILYKAKQKESSMRANYTQRLESKVKERTIKLKEANQKLEWLSNIDGLTQIFNRRYFDTVLSQELLNHQKSKETLVLMICDIDYFKRYNDTYGHLAGDDCIKMVASILKAHCKKNTEIVARYGGEEFALIMPKTSHNEAKERAEAIRLSIADKALPHQSSDLGDFVSISIGVAVMNATKTTTIENIIGLADEALYKSKNSGRNKTTVKSN
ncbi:diguanylate cyclase domain-containing protein [Vibrio algarum]|uniref:diguanylate cyclase n=1 Tax=Vibrio algarum TaxID=3020714 RepID=A0ABT4YSA7_9VIBR|nr:diguanylate cyclase [Vibrio sp. KJ40-1]MDB1124445.1 diguanylate cyclase [Vibrio sp. KJ40-1]